MAFDLRSKLVSPTSTLFDAQQATYGSPSSRAKVVTALCVLQLAVAVLSAVLLLDALEMARGLAAGIEFSAEDIDNLTRRATEVGWISIALRVFFFTSFCFWTYRVARNAMALSGRPLEVSPGWAVGYYFIPIANLWRPYTALVEISHASDIDGRRSHALLTAWWIAWLISNAGRIFDRGADTVVDAESWTHQIIKELVVLALEAMVVVLTMAVVRRITRGQTGHAARAMPEARVA